MTQKRRYGLSATAKADLWRRWESDVLGVMGAMLSITGIFGMAAYSWLWRRN